MIARVVLISAAGDTGPLDYAVDAPLDDVVCPGVRVLVPLGARRAVGIVTELAAASSQPRLKKIVAVLDPQPLLDETLLRLCRWMADYYLCSFGEAVSTALPGSLRISVERLVRLASPLPRGLSINGYAPRYAAKRGRLLGVNGSTSEEGDPQIRSPRVGPVFSGAVSRGCLGENRQSPQGKDRGEGNADVRLKPAERELLSYLQASGPQTTRAIGEKWGVSGQRMLTGLQRHGLVTIEERLRGGEGPTKHERFYQSARDLSAEDVQEWRRKRPAQYAVYAYLRDHPLRRARAAELHPTFANLAPKLGALIKAGLVSVVEEEVYRSVLPHVAVQDRPVELTAAQRDAVTAVERSLGRAFRTLLLWGVTGSGKTEVYLRCMATCLAAGRTALVLVPEISLTHQLVDRVRARFGDRVAVLHSGLSAGERWDEWRKIARGEAPIVVGARSAVFAPLPRLGLIVVDEEHASAYKQEDGVRYNGRDVAVVRAKLSGCPVLLGSATPAMESFYNGRLGRYEVLTLPQRVEERPLPAVEVVDLRRSPAAGKALLISPPLAAALEANLAARGQSLIFLNRRGFANFLQCHACGDSLMCPNCSVSLTLHRRWHALRCHHCEYTVRVPTVCPGCGAGSLSAWGAGTEQVEAALRHILPGARIGRMDRDTTSRKGSQREIFAAWERREYDVLVGTQMITKGHDVAGVTLVGVLLADLSLNFPDFRAAESTFQLLTQVAGRAGRGARPGRVIVQTLQPTHYSLQWSAQHDYGGFAEQELAVRRELGYPPFARLVQLRCEGERAEVTERIVHSLATEVRRAADKGVGVLGPAPAPLERLRGRYRWQLLMRGRNGAAVRKAARAGRDAIRRQARAAAVRVIVDVDPYNML